MKNKLMAAALLAALATTASQAAFADDHKEKGPRGDKGMEHHMKADTNDDGMISLDEFLTMKKQRFAEMDTNNDGNLSREEMRDAHKKYRKKFKEMRQERRQKNDSGNDE